MLFVQAWKKIKQSSSGVQLQAGSAQLTLTFKPLRVDLSIASTPAASFNARQMFNYEYLREKQVGHHLLRYNDQTQQCIAAWLNPRICWLRAWKKHADSRAWLHAKPSSGSCTNCRWEACTAQIGNHQLQNLSTDALAILGGFLTLFAHLHCTFVMHGIHPLGFSLALQIAGTAHFMP